MNRPSPAARRVSRVIGRSGPGSLAALIFMLCASAVDVRASTTVEPEDARCTPESLLVDARLGLSRGSPALRSLLREMLQEAALAMSDEALLRALANEDDPAMLEALGAAIASKAEMTGNPALVRDLVARAAGDEDPKARAALVRALRGTGSVELMKSSGVDLGYGDLINDASPEVRAEVVENLVVEDDAVYSGHSSELAEAAFATADRAHDRETAARIVRETSTEDISAERALALRALLDDESSEMRAAAARALGGVSRHHASDALTDLVARYRRESDLEVRRELLASIARLERARAIPTLRALRDVDTRLASEVDAWIAVLEIGLPEWRLIEREKNRHQP